MGCKWFPMFLVMMLVSLEGWWSEGERCWEEERSALLQLKPFFNSYNDLYSWVENSECCEWEKVECNDITGRVIGIDLSFINYWKLEEWYLNASLFSPFQQLQSLDLSNNQITGCIENEGFEKLSRLSNLERMNLAFNKFNNSILSSLAGLSSLKYLDLYGNRIEGAVNIDGLHSLKELDMSYNEIDQFVNPKGLYSLKSLELLDVGWNKIDKFVNSKDYKFLKKLNVLDLSGTETIDANALLQSTLRSFPLLRKLNLRSSNLNQTVAARDLHNLTSLEELYLDFSSLHISFLQTIATFTSLKHLSMMDCEVNGISQVQGPINFKNLKSLVMDGVTFNNSFCQIIRPIATLKKLSLRRCGLNGTLHDQGLCEMVHLEELYISYNALRDTLPLCLANLTSIRVLDISNNLLQVPISLTPLYNLSKLKEFESENNQMYIETMPHSLTPKFQLNSITLSGYTYEYGATFPRFLYHQYDLQKMDLSHIKLNGEFPNWLIENNTKLDTLHLSNNSLSGPFLLPIHPHMNLTTLVAKFL